VFCRTGIVPDTFRRPDRPGEGIENYNSKVDPEDALDLGFVKAGSAMIFDIRTWHG
jgi:hypothetical protein